MVSKSLSLYDLLWYWWRFVRLRALSETGIGGIFPVLHHWISEQCGECSEKERSAERWWDESTRWNALTWHRLEIELHLFRSVVGLLYNIFTTNRNKWSLILSSWQVLHTRPSRREVGYVGGAPIWAGGHDAPLLEAKGTGGHNLGIIRISHI